MKRLRDGLLARRGNPKAEMPFLDHLEELRRRILWSLLALGVCFGAGLAAVHYLDVTRFLLEPGQEVMGPDWQLIYLAPADAFFVFLKISLTVGLVLASPIIVYQVWAFLAPALEKREKRTILPALFMGLVLFLIGVALAYFLALPLTLRFLTGFMADFMVPNLTAAGYFGFVVQLLLGFGILFELPVVILVLSVLGVVTPAFLRSKRRHAIVILTVVAAMLSPGDMVQLTVLAMVPLILLYEFSIWLSALAWRGREERESAVAGEAAAGSVDADADAGADADGDAGPPGGADPEGGSPAPPANPPSAGPEAPSDEPNPYTHGDPARTDDPESPSS